MDDHVMVQPVRTFLEGCELKVPESNAYPVSRSRAIELRMNGLVELAEPDPAPEPAEAPAPAATSANSVAPCRRGRPPKPR